MVDLGKIAIPAIGVLVVVGVIGFFLAFNLYPEKHVNVTVEGRCYELLDEANQRYQNLASRNAIEKLRLQLAKVEPDTAYLPIIFTGKDTDISDFQNKYRFNVTSQQKLKYFPNINASAMTANISKSELGKVVQHLTLADVATSAKTVVGSIAIESNKYITAAESTEVSNILNERMNSGIKQIIATSSGVKSAECRTGVH
jgi:hypothetical protein